jgi:magnesium-transporting ATPase (P-type)
LKNLKEIQFNKDCSSSLIELTPPENITKGKIVHLIAGDIAPADLLIIESAQN